MCARFALPLATVLVGLLVAPATAATRDEPIGGPLLGARGVVLDGLPGAPALPRGLNASSWLVADADTGEVLAARGGPRAAAPGARAPPGGLTPWPGWAPAPTPGGPPPAGGPPPPPRRATPRRVPPAVTLPPRLDPSTLVRATYDDAAVDGSKV